MRINPNQSRQNVNSVPFGWGKIESVCRKCGIPRYHWPCYFAFVNGNGYRTEAFHHRLDDRPEYQLALLAIVNLFT